MAVYFFSCVRLLLVGLISRSTPGPYLREASFANTHTHNIHTHTHTHTTYTHIYIYIYINILQIDFRVFVVVWAMFLSTKFCGVLTYIMKLKCLLSR